MVRPIGRPRPQQEGEAGHRGGSLEDDHVPLAATEPRRLYQQVADRIRLLIDREGYAAGSRLPAERELARMLGVSRPTIREALIALEVEGRLRIRVGSGIYVTAHSSSATRLGTEPIEGPFEVLRARAFVESAIAEEAARRATEADIGRIDAVLAEFGDRPVARESWIALDRRFHVAVVATLDNAVLTRTVGELFDQRINPYFERLARYIVNESTQLAAHREHVAIRDAIAAKDPEQARAAMHEHLKHSHRRYAKDFGEEPLAYRTAAPAAGRIGARAGRSGTQQESASNGGSTWQE
jgi:DNA-binding FadR family transcriptional regulator